MKRSALSLLLVLALLLNMAAPVLAAEEQTITSGDWVYLVEDGEATLVEYLGSSTDVVVPAQIDGLKVAWLGDDSPNYTAFRNIQLTSVQLPEGLEHIGVSCFAGQKSLTEVVIPESITTISYHVFSGCSGLKSVKLPETLTTIESFAFYGCTSLETIELPESLEAIEQMAFQNCTGLKEITVPCYIGFWVFNGCTALEKATISGATVGTLAFDGCTSLTDVTLTNSVKTLREGAFANTGLTSIFIPASVTTMEYYCVGYTADVNETGWINGTDKIDSFVIYGYAGTAAEEFARFYRFPFVPEGQFAPTEGKFGEDAYWSFDPDTGKLSMWGHGLVDEYNHGEQPWFNLGAQITSVEISGNLWEIPAISFYRDFPSLTEVIVTAEDCSLREQAFAELENLETVTLSAGTDIGPHCFEGSALESIVLPADDTYTGQAAFKNCKNLKKVVFGHNTEEVNNQTFYGCTSLKEVELPESTWSIGYQAFACSGLESIEIPDNVVVLQGESFRGCENLKSVKLPASLIRSDEGESHFADCTSLTTVIMPQGADLDFDPWFFKNCDSLTDISFHTASTIGQSMYQGCDGLTSLTIPQGVKEIGSNAFSGCLNLSYVTVPETVTAIGDQAFAACGRLKAVAFRGDAPVFTGNVFAADNLVCYYPAGNATWTPEVMGQYGGSVTWIPYEVLPFMDVPVNAFYFDPVAWAVEKGITAGATADSFNPNGQCQRGQIVTFLWRAAGCPIVEAENPFTDVKETDFYYDAVLWAVENGITSGTSANTFSPFKTCSRAEVVTFLWRAGGKPQVQGENPFTDVTEADFYHDAVLWAAATGITAGVDATHFAPLSICNRAQVVTFLYRVDQK